MFDVYENMKILGLVVPEISKPKFSYVPGKIVGNLIFISGQTPTKNGQLVYKGKLGKDILVEDGYKAAQISVLNCIGELNIVLKDLNRIREIVKLNGYVASSKNFNQQPAVVNGASDLLVKIFGEKGKHARVAIGVNELPDNAPVEIELIATFE